MDYRPTGHLDETIVAGAELTADSAIKFMSLIEEKKQLEKDIQEERENAFFKGDSVFSVDIEDVGSSDLPELDLEELIAVNNGKWRTTIEECYSFRESREPERPLSRVEAVSEQMNLPICDTNSMVFDTDDVEVKDVNGEEIIEIRINDSDTIELFVQTENMEQYQGMFVPPITRDIDSIKGYLSNFDRLTIRNNTEAAQRVLNHHKPDTIDREIKETEIVLSNDIDKTTYLPEQTYGMDEGSKLAEDVSKMQSKIPLPNEKTRKFLFETLEQGYFFTEVRTKLFLLLTGDSNTILSYSHAVSPEYIDQFCQITGLNAVSVPQEEVLFLTEKDVPSNIRDFNADFPEKNLLDSGEKQDLYKFVDLPDFVNPTSNWVDDIKSKEILLNLYENDVVNLEEVVSYYANPWDRVIPEKKSVMKAIRYGDRIRKDMEEIDEKYGTELIDSIIKWEKRSIYRRSNFPRE